MLAKIRYSCLAKTFAPGVSNRILNAWFIQKGYDTALKNNNHFKLVKQTSFKPNNLANDSVIFKNVKARFLLKRSSSLIFGTVLVFIRMVVIVSIVCCLFLFYWITRIYGAKIYPTLYIKVIEFLGAAFIKLGQWMSTRRDLYPEELCAILSRLQRDSAAHSWYYTQELLKAAYGHSWNDLFVEFDRVPVGSGCCAQVYRAVVNRNTSVEHLVVHDGISVFVEEGSLKKDTSAKAFTLSSQDHTPVAVKILHPRVEEQIKRDLSILQFLSKLVTALLPSLEWLSLVDCINEFSQIMEKQVNLELEAENLTKFTEHFSNLPEISFPQPCNDLTCREILVETFHEGRPINEYIDEKNYDLRHKLAKLGLTAIFKMIFDDNFVHCDLHPGNIIVQEKPLSIRTPQSLANRIGYPRIVILDCGLVTELNEVCRRNFFEVFRSVAEGDGKKAANLIMNHSIHKTPDPDGFMNTMDDILKRHMQKGLKLKNINVGDVISELFSAMVRYQVKQDGAFSSVILSIAVIEGLGRSLDPGIDLIRELSPFVIKLDKV